MENNNKRFKPFDRIIWKHKNGTWQCDVYSSENNDMLFLVGAGPIEKGKYDILPYEGNEHLVGTSAEEEIKLEEEEFLVCFDYIDYFEAKDFCLSAFDSLYDNTVRTKDGNNWDLFIRFSDFNPNDMEETKKHILCVKNGKIVKYRHEE